MKKLYFLLLLAFGFSNAQIVNIPDANFKAKLIALGVDTNSDGNIQQSEALATNNLDLSSSNISDLTGIQAFTSLSGLYCQSNELTSLNISGLNNLTYFNCSYNQIAILSINGGNFTTFNCSGNQMNSLTATNISCSSVFECGNNNLTYLNISNSSFFLLNCSNNQLSTLSLSSTIISFELNCSNNQINNLDLTGKLFSNFICDNNLLTTLDVSTCTNLNLFFCNGNPLTSLFIKNGRNENISFSGDANLLFICADESQIMNIQSQANPATLVSSYCSFTPGGSYNTITGSVIFDSNSNGCDASDIPQPNIKINVYNGTGQESISTNNSGNYTFYTNTGNYTLSLDLENPTWFLVNPNSAAIPFTNNNNTTTQDFCITANGIHNDVEVVIAPITTARPGFDAVYKIVYKNKGNQILSGNVNFSYDDSVLDFVSANINTDSQTTGNLSWNYSNLNPFESKSIIVTLNVNAATETPAINIGDVLSFSSTINPVSGDENPTDNTFTYSQTVVGSFDPNDKTCLEGNTVSPSKIGDYLHYNINFENTGTAAATFVVVKDIIDTTKFDIASLQIMDSSHPMTTRITGNKVEFIFENINLGANEHGNVVFKIKTKNTLVSGDSVNNNANIFFDYNAPITTNTATTTFQTLSNSVTNLDKSISVYPNPTSSIVNIKSNNSINSIELYDAQGRILQTNLVNQNETSIDISDKSNGIYFLKIVSEKGSKVEKVIKQ